MFLGNIQLLTYYYGVIIPSPPTSDVRITDAQENRILDNGTDTRIID